MASRRKTIRHHLVAFTTKDQNSHISLLCNFLISYIPFNNNQIYSLSFKRLTYTKRNYPFWPTHLVLKLEAYTKLLKEEEGGRQGEREREREKESERESMSESKWRGMGCYLRIQQICHRLFLVILSLWIPLKACQNAVAMLTLHSSFTNHSLIHTKGSILFYSNYKICCSILYTNPTNIIKTK